MDIVSLLDLFEFPPIFRQFFRGMEQGGKTLGADIYLGTFVLKGYQWGFLFRAIAIQAGFHIPRKFL